MKTRMKTKRTMIEIKDSYLLFFYSEAHPIFNCYIRSRNMRFQLIKSRTRMLSRFIYCIFIFFFNPTCDFFMKINIASLLKKNSYLFFFIYSSLAFIYWILFIHIIPTIIVYVFKCEIIILNIIKIELLYN